MRVRAFKRTHTRYNLLKAYAVMNKAGLHVPSPPPPAPHDRSTHLNENNVPSALYTVENWRRGRAACRREKLQPGIHI